MEDFFIGRSVPLTQRTYASPLSAPPSATSTPNSHDLRRRFNTSGRTTPESTEPSLSLGSVSSAGTINETGSLYGIQQNREIWMPSTSQPESNTTGQSNRSRLTTLWLRLWNAPSMFSGARRAPESPDVHGRRQAPTHTLRIRGRSSGAATRAALTWSSTNLGEASTLDTYYAGLIDTPYLLRSRAVPLYSARPPSGSPPTYPRNHGIPGSTPVRRRLFYDDSTSSTSPGR